MFNFFKKGREFQRIAESIHGLNQMLAKYADTYIGNYIKTSDDSVSELRTIAYIFRKGVIIRLEENKFSLTTPIIVPSYGKTPKPLLNYFGDVSSRITVFSMEAGVSEEIEDIVAGGPSYFEFERTIPRELINKI
jgi:hypothetical protein